jgi:hypothetical protein
MKPQPRSPSFERMGVSEEMGHPGEKRRRTPHRTSFVALLLFLCVASIGTSKVQDRFPSTRYRTISHSRDRPNENRERRGDPLRLWKRRKMTSSSVSSGGSHCDNARWNVGAPCTKDVFVDLVRSGVAVCVNGGGQVTTSVGEYCMYHPNSNRYGVPGCFCARVLPPIISRMEQGFHRAGPTITFCSELSSRAV